MVSRQINEAITNVELRSQSKRDRALYLLDKGLLLRMQANFEESNLALEQAKILSEKLSAISLREQAAATSVNDSMRSYEPPAFERVMVHCIKGLNYLQLNDLNSARVEILQMDELLKTEEDLHFPFARYFSGLVFEANRESDNALIAYRKAYQAYQEIDEEIPLALQQDLLRLTQYLGLTEEHEDFKEEFLLEEWPNQEEIREKSKIVAIVFNGLMPRKHSQEINAQSPSDGQLHRISTPFYETRSPHIRRMSLSSGELETDTELFDRLDYHAQEALSDQMPAIIARTIARVSLKNNMVDNATKEAPLLGAVLNIATFLTEVADTRGWNTLPQQLLIASLYVEPGFHDIELDLDNSSATQVSLGKGRTLFISSHWPDSHVTSRRP